MKRTRIAAYDSLKFFAILGIIIYHYFESVLPGGYLGVDIFFVISGFLLGHRSEKTIREGKVYPVKEDIKGKFISLFKPLLVFMALSLVLLVLVRRDFLNNIYKEVISSLLFVNNWQQIFSGQSYFDTFMNPSIYTHLWYLSVYFQVIVGWSLAYPILRKKLGADLGGIRKFLFGLSLVSASLMALISLFIDDPTRVYYGTDTRMYAFILGTIGGLSTFDSQLRNKIRGRKIDPVILGLLALVGVFMVFMGDDSFFTYKYGMYVFSILVMILVYLLSFKGSFSRLALSFKPLAILGEMSLGIYLWYQPIFILFYQAARIDKLSKLAAWGQIFAIFALGLVFYKMVMKFKNLDKKESRILSGISLVLVVIILLLSPRTQEAAMLNQEKMDQEKLLEDQNQKNIKEEDTQQTEKKPSQSEDKDKLKTETKAQDSEDSSEIKQENEETSKDLEAEFESYRASLSEDEAYYYQLLTKEEAIYAFDKPVTLFGDSLTLMSTQGLSSVFPKSTIFCEVAMTLADAFPMAEEALANGQVNDTVIIFLGSNGGFAQESMEDFIDLFGDRQVYLVSTHVNRFWREEVNTTLDAVLEVKDGAKLIDWSAYYDANGNDQEWIRPEDDIHFSSDGVCEYINCLLEGMMSK